MEKKITETVNATTPEQDGKSNSPDVPEVMLRGGGFEKIIHLRFKHDTDLLSGLREAVETEKIENAVILTGIGSVRGYHTHVVSNRDFPSKNIFIEDLEKPADVLNVNGYIINSKVHAHITLSDKDIAFGGHLEEGTAVFTFAIVTLGILGPAADLSGFDDKTLR